MAKSKKKTQHTQGGDAQPTPRRSSRKDDNSLLYALGDDGKPIDGSQWMPAHGRPDSSQQVQEPPSILRKGAESSATQPTVANPSSEKGSGIHTDAGGSSAKAATSLGSIPKNVHFGSGAKGHPHPVLKAYRVVIQYRVILVQFTGNRRAVLPK